VVDDLRHHVRDEKAARGEDPRELSAQEVEEIKAFGQAEGVALVTPQSGELRAQPRAGLAAGALRGERVVAGASALSPIEKRIRREVKASRGR
jgi:hypothetical protein